MIFTFPENKLIIDNKIKNYNGNKFSEIDILDPTDNLITIDKVDYYFTYLEKKSGNKGGNSIILKLYVAQNIDESTLTSEGYPDPDAVLKLHRKSWSTKRFTKEVEALKKCREKGFENVINIYSDGICGVFNPKKGRYEEYLFYTMEYAEYDLKKFIELNHVDLSFDEKISLCKSISEGIKDLRSLEYYHRDIKPDNIFMVGKTWKIGDLGLVSEQNVDIDDINEFVGPRGWISPEVMNKYLSNKRGFTYSFDCDIDHQSDIFQLGKVFWYIFQHNAPIGSIKGSDFKIKHSGLYTILRTMLNHSKVKRYKNIQEVIDLLKLIQKKSLKELVAS